VCLLGGSQANKIKVVCCVCLFCTVVRCTVCVLLCAVGCVVCAVLLSGVRAAYTCYDS
jgi:hypothetical protein